MYNVLIWPISCHCLTLTSSLHFQKMVKKWKHSTIQVRLWVINIHWNALTTKRHYSKEIFSFSTLHLLHFFSSWHCMKEWPRIGSTQFTIHWKYNNQIVHLAYMEIHLWVWERALGRSKRLRREIFLFYNALAFKITSSYLMLLGI